MIRILFLLLTITLIRLSVAAQELYVFSEPASNMPSKSISAKLTSRFPDSKYNDYFKQRYTPEVMFGVNKNLMVHVASTFSDFYTPKVSWESVRGYAKWRFYSSDDVHQHFRMAAFVEGSYSESPFLYEDINLEGDNSGIQAGIIATQLVSKFAISATVSGIRVFAEQADHVGHQGHSVSAVNYSLSAGYLLFPRNYTDYRQTNLNLYVEFLGMSTIDPGHTMIDIAPAIQLIFNSNTKLNFGARFQAKGEMLRVGENNYYISLERTFLNALKRKK